jgi:hypothetical protein
MTTYPRIVAVLVVAAIAALSLGGASVRAADPLIVTRADDPAPDGCKPDDCSAREAFIDANANPGPDTVQVGALDVILSIEGDDDDSQAGDLDVTDSLTIEGAGPDSTTIDADRIDRVIDVPEAQGGGDPGITLTINNATITGGIHSAIRTAGFLTLDNVVVSASTSDTDGGGILVNYGGMFMQHSTVFKNSVSGGGKGGGIASHRVINVQESTIFANSAGNGGGGIWADGGLGLQTSTLTQNSAGSGLGGGAVYVENAPAEIKYTTIAYNHSGNPGGGVWNKNSDVTLTGALLAGNAANNQPNDCDGDVHGDHNLVQTTTGCNLTGAGNITGQDPMLAAQLANNGGPTQTLALNPGSPAINAGGSDCLVNDQRGVMRDVGLCDIGAYEYTNVGDINCDNVVNLLDVTGYLAFYGAGKDLACPFRADIDCDHALGPIDVLSLIRVIARLAPLERPSTCPDIAPLES